MHKESQREFYKQFAFSTNDCGAAELFNVFWLVDI